MRRLMLILLVLAAAAVSAAWPVPEAAAGACWDLKPLRPVGCLRGHVVCVCSGTDEYGAPSCRWVWVCE